MSWKCKCGQVVVSLKACVNCGEPYPSDAELDTYDDITAIIHRRNIDGLDRVMSYNMQKPSKESIELLCKMMAQQIEQADSASFDTPGREALHALFFNHAKVFIADMDTATRRQFRDWLSVVAHWGKSGLLAVEETERSLKAEQKEWLVTSQNPDQSVTDAIAAVKVRKERMSKADKVLANLGALGVSKEFSDQIAASMTKIPERDFNKGISFNSPKQTKPLTSELCRIEQHSNCPGRFTADGVSNECKCNCHLSKPEETETSDSPKPFFNPFASK